MRLLACCYNDPEMQIDPDTVYPIRPDCRDDAPKTRFKPRAGLTLSPKRWKLLHNEEGVLDIAGVIKRVQRGGIHPTIKGEVWEFLLGCYDPKSTTEQRNQLRQQRRLEYEKLKTKCREMDTTVGSGRVISMPVITEDGQPIEDPNADGGARPSSVGSEQQTSGAPLPKEVIQWKLTLHQIGLDVNRTDRVLVYYESQENLARLWDILSVYSWVDKDIGYCQGMSDLCSPISIILEHEADAFWCFERLMRRVVQLSGATCLLDSSKKAISTFWNKDAKNLDGGEYLFAFRMLMVLFRREFSFVDTMYLWELMWSMEYNPNLFSMLESDTGASKATTKDESVLRQCGKFERKNLQADKKDEEIPLSVFVVASVLEARNKKLLGEAKGLDDVVKILNEITGSLDAKKACREALQIHEKYLNAVKA
ncbi:TBC1 domain family member 15-like [Panicum miliaceum]|uniref:TBC1 domain family member 15-like n=1 Tax=Panicum miliaceum TaxID=4540 RepID=A0A3L6RV08_PANMI|nr:TBC1 domain family member 15-like [Panicum miliaceum]